ncbi:MAG: hypothetical protein ACI84C_002063 [Flavobacteriales bacterium]|jgi:hypothetical protein
MYDVMHQAAQYIAAVGKSFLESVPDGNHTNMRWDSAACAMVGRPIDEAKEISLALNYSSYSLEFVDTNVDVLASLYLGGSRHDAILFWIQEQTDLLGIEGDLDFDIQYELPYPAMEMDMVFPEEDSNELQRLSDMRTAVQNALSTVLNPIAAAREIRVWPHHFDIGSMIITQVEDNALVSSIGVGMAVPDAMVDDFYLFTTAWRRDGVGLDNMANLTLGKWRNPDWNGATLEAGELSEAEMVVFFQETIGTLAQLLLS